MEIQYDRISASHIECFSSSPSDGGCRFKDIATNDGKWVMVDVPCDEWEEHLAFCRSAQLIGHGYDFFGVLAFVWPWAHQRRNRLFCSEAVVTVLQTIGRFKGIRPSKISPNQLFLLAQALSV